MISIRTFISFFKKLFTLSAFVILSFTAKAASETLTSGSFIINMGITPQTVGNGLKPYGMMYDLIKNYGVTVKWVISQNKVKDGDDFIYGGVHYKGGTFIIAEEYRSAAVNARISFWQTQGVIGVSTTTPLTVDVTLNLYAAPRWVLDAQNGSIAQAFLTAAGVPATAYYFKTPAALDCCDDIFVMPHADPTWATHGNLYNWNRSCLGGIWAGCHAVSVMEGLFNPSNPAQNLSFLSTNRLLNFGSHSKGTPPYTNYWQNDVPNYALASDPVFQMMGSEDAAHLNGSEQIYMPDKSRSSEWRPTTKIGTYDSTQINVPSTGNFPAAVTLYGRGEGDPSRGLVMYQSGHNIGGTTTANIAAQREFFNWSFLAALDKVPFVNSYINVPARLNSGSYYTGLYAFGGSPVANYPLKYEWICTAGGTFASAFGTNGTSKDSITNFTAPIVSAVTPAIIYCKISDACGRSVTKPLNVRIFPPEAPPVAVSDTATFSALCTVSTVSLNVLSNDYDVNENMISSITLLNTGTVGTFVNNGGGSVTYFPGINYAGFDTARYRVCDDSSNCSTALIVVRTSGAGSCSLTQFQQTFTDYADLVIVAASITNPTFALGASNFTQGSNATAARFNALTDSLIVRLSQTLQSGDTVKIYAASDNPSCVSFSVLGGLTSSIVGTVQNFQTPAASNKQYAVYNYLVTAPTKYVKISIRSTACAVNLDVDALEYNYKVCTSALPSVNADVATTGKNASLTIPVKLNDVDPQSLALTYSIVTNPAHGSTQIKPTGILYNPAVGYTGADTFVYKACNANCLCDTAVVRLSILADPCGSNQVGTYKTGNAATVIASNSIGSGGAAAILGAPDQPDAGNGNVGQFNALTDSVVLDLTDTIPAGDTIFIRWASDNNSASTLVATASLDNVTYGNTVSISTPINAGRVYQTSYYIAASGTRYVKLKISVANNADVDALSYAFWTCNAIPNRPPVALNDTSTTYVSTAVAKNAGANDVDPDGNTLTWSLITSSTTKGSATISGSVITYTPNAGIIGADTIIYKVCDNGTPSLCDTALYIITILPLGPTANKDTISTLSGVPVTITVPANDMHPVTVFTYATSLRSDILAPANGSVSLSGNNIQYAPLPGFSGIDSFAYQVCDNQVPSICDTALVYVTVVNRAPVAVLDTITTGTCNAVTINAISNDTDPENGVLSITSVTVNTPGSGTASIVGNKIIFVPSSSPIFLGNASLTYTLCDNGTPELCVSGSVTVFVVTPAPPNNPPLTVNDFDSTYANQVLFVDVIDNDEDPDVDDIMIDSTASGLLAPSKGTIQYLANGLIIYTPNPALSAGTDSFQYKVCDVHPPLGSGCVIIPQGCSLGKVYIKFQNRPPVANDDSTSTIPTASVSGTVAANDIEPDGQPMVFSKIVGPSHGSISFDAAGAYTYTPNGVYLGYDSVYYKVCDNGIPSLCDTALLLINITLGPLPPNPQPDTITTYSGTPVSGTVAPNDTDPNGNLNPNTFTVTGGPSQGSIIFNANGTYTYTPDSSFVGIDIVSYQVCDSTSLCATSTLTITVLDPSPLAWRDLASTQQDTAVTISVLSNDTYAGNGPASGPITITDNPRHGIAVVNDNGTPTNPLDDKIEYTPAALYYGADTLTYEICDANGDCDTAIVFITVNQVNLPPVAVMDTAVTNEDIPVVISILNNDTDGDGGIDTSSVAITDQPLHGTVLVNANGTINYTPSVNYSGDDTLIYQVCDLNIPPAKCHTAIVFITIVPVNDPPVAVMDNATTMEDSSVVISILNNDGDIDGSIDTSSVTITDQPNHGAVIVNADGTLSYTPSPDYNGNDTLIYQVCDNGSPLPAQCDTAIVYILITPVNDPPLADPDTISANEDMPVTIAILSNDTDDDGGIDSTSVTISVQPNHGNIVVNANGTLLYTPSANYNGTDTLIYQVCDLGTPLPALCDTAIVYINVLPGNDPPVAIMDTIRTMEDVTVTISILTNDSDADGGIDSTSVTITAQPNHGSVIVNGNGTLSYTPSLNYNGNDTLIYQVCDVGTPLPSQCDTAIVYILITPVNDPPVAVLDTISTNEDTPVTIATLSNDTDGDGGIDSTSVTISVQPDHGNIVVNADGTLLYTPAANYNGPDTLIYQVCDLGTPLPALCDTAVVLINILPVNDPPVAIIDTVRTSEDVAVTISILTNDSDADGGIDSTSVTITAQPNHGSIIVNGNGTLSYTPSLNYNGNDTMIYQVCDVGTSLPSQCDTAIVYILITPVNDPPVAVLDTISTNEDSPVIIGILGNDTDVDGGINSASVTISVQPHHGNVIVNAGGTLKYTPAANYNGKDTLIYQVCDLGTPLPALCDTAIVFITILPVNDPPVAIMDTIRTPEDTPVIFSVLTNDADTDGGIDNTSVTITALPNHGSVIVNGNGTLSYTPSLNYYGNDTLIYRVCDLGTPLPAQCDTAVVFIFITPVNDPPIVPDTTITIPEDSTITVCLPFTDPDAGDTHVTVRVCGPFNGTVTSGPGLSGFQTCLTYVPSPGFSGQDSICVVVCDNRGACDVGHVYLNISAVNDPPIAVRDTATTSEDTPVTISILNNDSDPDGGIDNTSVTVAGQPNHGSVLVNGNGTITYTPSLNYFGNDTLIYQVCDLGTPLPALCDTAIVYIVVRPINDPPVVPDTIVTVPEDSLIIICLSITDPDPGDSWTVSLCGGPLNGTLISGPQVSGNNVCLTYAPDASWVGTDSVCLVTCDAANACDTSKVKLIVTCITRRVAVDTSICQGDSVIVGIHVYTASGTYVDTLIASTTCDSIITTNLTVRPVTWQTIDSSICQGDSVTVGGQTFDATGTFTVVIPNAQGCDSTINLNLTVIPTTAITIDSSICQGDSVIVGGQTFNSTGTFTVVIPNTQGCDSTITLNLTVIPTTAIIIDSSICQGDSVIVGGQTFDATGTFTVVIPNAQGCDSTITLNLIVIPTTSQTIDSSICQGDSVIVGGQIFNTTGTFTVVIPNAQGCDSTITLNLTIIPTTAITIDSSICQGDSLTVGAQIFNTTGTFTVVIPNAQGCDSTITLNLIVIPTTAITIDSSICQGDSVTVGGQAFNGTGTFTVVIPNAQGCDSTITLNLIIIPTTSQTIDSSICQGDSVTAGGQTFNATGTFTVVIPNAQGCDSTITLNLIVIPTTSQTIDSSICQGDSVTAGGQTFNATGTFTVVIPNAQGCDSTITLNLTVIPATAITIDSSICQGDSVTVGGQTFNATGTFTVVIPNAQGCDSTITLNLTIIPTTAIIIDSSVCQGDSVTVGGQTFNATGTFTVVIPNAQGCDSTITLNLIVIPTTAQTIDSSICQGDSVTVGGQTFNATGTFTVVIPNAQGCDSMITLNLTVIPTTAITIDSSICQGDSITVGGQTFNATGTFTVVIPNAQGCDSTITLNLIVIPTTSQTIDSSICQGDSVIVGGQTFNSTGTFTVVIPNAQGCDSTITLNLIVIPTTAITIDSSICQGDSVTVGGQTFDATGTFTVVIPNAQGCDSTITLNLIVRPTTSQTINSSICQGDSITVGGQTFNATGTFTVVIPNAQGCDSTITLNLIIIPTTSQTIDSNICQGDSVTVGGQTFNATGTFTVVIPNAQGCDSTITLNLIIIPTTSQTIDSSICQGDSVAVGGQTFNATGTFTVVIPNAQGCDSTITLNLTVIPTTAITIDSSICQGDSITVGGQTFNATGTFTVVIPNAQGCDSTITLNLIVIPTTSQTIDSSICQGDSITVGGQTFNATGTFTVVIPNAQGCDSMITLNLTVIPTTTITIDSSICQGDSVTVGGQTFNATGTFTVVIPNAQGCDSTITLNLAIRLRTLFTIDDTICQGDSIIIGTQAFTTTGTFTAIITNSQGCDSVITLNLVVRPTSSQTIDSSICQGDSVIVGGQAFNSTGTHTVIIQNTQSCDSIITLHLTVIPATSETIDTTICQNDSISVGGQTFNATGTFIVIIPNAQGCDSTITLNLNVRSITSATISSSICQGDSVIVGGQIFNAAGTYTVTIPNAQGCDSIITLNLSVNNCNTIDTIREIRPVHSTALICTITKPATGAATITSCDGSTAGTNALGSWSISDSCLLYTAGIIKGFDSLCIEACDAQPIPVCTRTIVIISVVGLPPKAVDDAVTTMPNTPVVIHILDNDSTFDTDPLALCTGGIVSGPSNGTGVINADGTITYTPSTDYIGRDSFQYQVCDTDGSDTGWVFIQVSGCEIPNAISPNGDGINDAFVIPCSVNPPELNIFNRWGIEVYRNDHYMNDWKGEYQDLPLPDGTYYYVMKFVSTQGTAVQQAGFVTIHR